jgi:hypothetical protein
MLWCLTTQRNNFTCYTLSRRSITQTSQVWETTRDLCVWNPAEGTITINTWNWHNMLMGRTQWLLSVPGQSLGLSLYIVINVTLQFMSRISISVWHSVFVYTEVKVIPIVWNKALYTEGSAIGPLDLHKPQDRHSTIVHIRFQSPSCLFHS